MTSVYGYDQEDMICGTESKFRALRLNNLVDKA